MGMITGIAIENFKGIRERVEIELRPLTLLFGANSAGKSSILQALQYAQEVFLRHRLDVDRTVAGGACVDLGGFHQLVHGHDLDQVVLLDFTVDLSDKENEFCSPLEGIHEFLQFDRWADVSFDSFGIFSTATIQVSIAWSYHRNGPFVAKCEILGDGKRFATFSASPEGRSVLLEINEGHPSLSKLSGWKPGQTDEALDDLAGVFEDPERTCLGECLTAFRQLCLPTEEGQFFLKGCEDALLRVESRFTIAERPLGLEERENIEQEILNGVSVYRFMQDVLEGLGRLTVLPLQALHRELAQHRYLGPVREVPERMYEVPRYPEQSRWANGLGAWDLLERADDALFEAVSDWLGDENRLNCGYRLRLKQFKELDLSDPLVVQLLTGRAFDEAEAGAKLDLNKLPTQSRLLIVTTDESIELRPSDVGIGISQVVPVIVTALDGEGRTVAIEQPELHIHPRLQAEIADLFLEAIERQRHRFLIETHSEHFILRLQRRIRETSKGELHEGRTLKSDAIAVYYVSQSEGSTRVRRIDLDKKGEFIQPWPDDFFELDFYERFA
jgi:hypothetical protein